MRRKRWMLVAVAGVVVCAAVVVTAMVVSRPAVHTLPPPRMRQYADTQACLLTGAQGLDDPQAAAVWAGMQDASAATAVKVSYIQVVGPATVSNAVSFATSLVQGKCTVVLGVGAAQAAAVRQEAAGNAGIRFVVIGADGPAAVPPGNVSVVAAGDASSVRSAVAGIVRDATV